MQLMGVKTGHCAALKYRGKQAKCKTSIWEFRQLVEWCIVKPPIREKIKDVTEKIFKATLKTSRTSSIALPRIIDLTMV